MEFVSIYFDQIRIVHKQLVRTFTFQFQSIHIMTSSFSETQWRATETLDSEESKLSKIYLDF